MITHLFSDYVNSTDFWSGVTVATIVYSALGILGAIIDRRRPPPPPDRWVPPPRREA